MFAYIYTQIVIVIKFLICCFNSHIFQVFDSARITGTSGCTHLTHNADSDGTFRWVSVGLREPHKKKKTVGLQKLTLFCFQTCWRHIFLFFRENVYTIPYKSMCHLNCMRDRLLLVTLKFWINNQNKSHIESQAIARHGHSRTLPSTVLLQRLCFISSWLQDSPALRSRGAETKLSDWIRSNLACAEK